ncbi:MAG TPA: cobyrinate a,c-diamide synthase [Polyangia bacterium]|nr:cobyrinate a,c-diamide synthase [Polyangia bacterium]
MAAAGEARALPRLVIAGTASGAGKTTVAVALARALRARGLRVAVFKCGPDYLDPTYLARAAGATCHNLDGWMMGRDAVRATFARAAAGADVAVIEGVMGLFDGASPTSEQGSTAEIAKWLEAPVVLCVDAGGMARTLAAIVDGCVRFDPVLRVAGVVCNRIGGRGHLQLLGKALEAARLPVALLGGFPVRAELAFPERHLGLRTADDGAIAEDTFAAWGAQAEQCLDVDGALVVARSAAPLADDGRAMDALPPAGAPRCRIGLAMDAAFHFYYEDNLRRLRELGATLVPFSPIADGALPAVDGLYLGGGYPEAHAAALADNRAMRAAVAAHAAAGRPIYAECGGFMYLCAGIRTADGARHPMVGLFPADAVMADRLQALGYVEVETQAPSILGPAGLRFRGHQFRYSSLQGMPAERGGAYRLRIRRGDGVESEGHTTGPGGGDGDGIPNVLGSYVHAHWASNPLVAEGFVAACARAATPP